MKIPERPPSWQELTDGSANFNVVLKKMNEPTIKGFLQDASSKYLHWDKLKFHLPPGLELREAWMLIKANRLLNQTDLPLTFMGKRKLSYGLAQHLEWLQKIDRQAGGNGLIFQSMPEDDGLHLTNSLMEEAIASSQLEGASTTRAVAKEMLRLNRRPRDIAEQMIANNYRAILEIRELKTEKLSAAMLCQLQQTLTEGTLDSPDASGRFRRPDEPIQVVDVSTGDVLHDPPLAEDVSWRIQELCDFANGKSSQFIHPVVKAIILHFTIGLIHPFVDGNGRAARALFYWWMLKEGYDAFEYLPISRILNNAPAKYARAYLYSETDDGDVTYFMHYQLECIVRAIDDLYGYLKNQRKLRQEALELLETHPTLNFRQCDMVKHFLHHPGDACTIPHYALKYRVSYPTAKSDLTGLEKVGFLVRSKAGRNARFKLVADLVTKIKRRKTMLP